MHLPWMSEQSLRSNTSGRTGRTRTTSSGLLAKDRNKPDPAITAKAQELVQGKTGFRDRVDAIASFVQSDIRYVAIEIGIGGNQPHAAADTFKARYGDCKDKATLLSSMLNAV